MSINIFFCIDSLLFYQRRQLYNKDDESIAQS